ncbi:MAG: hypothetical protein ACLTMP_05505 [Eggerthella lenta]
MNEHYRRRVRAALLGRSVPLDHRRTAERPNRVNKVTPTLWERYPARGPRSGRCRDVEGIIRTIGCFHTKAANVSSALRW